MIRQTEKRGALNVTGRVLQNISCVCSYAVQTGRLEASPAAELKNIRKTRKAELRTSLNNEELDKPLAAEVDAVLAIVEHGLVIKIERAVFIASHGVFLRRTSATHSGVEKIEYGTRNTAIEAAKWL